MLVVAATTGTRVRIRAGTVEDHPAIERTWREAGWLEDDDDATHLPPFRDAATWTVGELVREGGTTGEVEATASTMDGSLRHGDADLPFTAVTSVNVGRVARGRGLAGATTAVAVARAADAGAVVAGLGIFDQGYYDRLGFGNMPPIVTVRVDPDTLRVGRDHRPPVRLGVEDAPSMARAYGRRRVHGSVLLAPDALAGYVRADVGWSEGEGFGLGYRDADGELTHYAWLSAKGEHGPYDVLHLRFADRAELHELLSLLRSLADQVRLLVVDEPPGVGLQELVTTPFRQTDRTRGAREPAQFLGRSWQQVRVLDVPAAVAVLHGTGPEVAFRLDVADPVADALSRARERGEVVDAPAWTGVAGRYRVVVGPTSSAAPIPPDAHGDLPLLTTTVNELSRWWLGVRPLGELALTAPITAPPSLVTALDAALHLPRPHFDLDF